MLVTGMWYALKAYKGMFGVVWFIAHWFIVSKVPSLFLCLVFVMMSHNETTLKKEDNAGGRSSFMRVFPVHFFMANSMSKHQLGEHAAVF